jgi:hypothetical protein
MHKRLRLKGWSEKELKRLHHAKEEAHRRRLPFARFLHKHLFWIVFFMAIVANIFMSFVFIPLMLMLDDLPMVPILVVSGIGFGFLFENLLSNVDCLSHRRVLLMVLVVPALAALSFMFASHFANFLALAMFLDLRHNILLLGFAYGLSFFVPFAIRRGFQQQSL